MSLVDAGRARRRDRARIRRRAAGAFLALRGLWFCRADVPAFDQQHRFGPNVAGNVRSGLSATTTLAEAEASRGRLWHQFRELFTRFDHAHALHGCAPFPVEQTIQIRFAGRPMETYVD